MAEAEQPAKTEEEVAKPEGEKKEEKKEKTEKKAKAKGKGDKGKGKGKGKPDGPTWGGQGYRLNVKNFGEETNEELKAMFEPFGTVVEAQVRMQQGKSKGLGFVIFAKEEDAKKAIAEMNDKDHDGKKLNVMPAERRPEEPAAKGKGKGKQDFQQQQQLAVQMQLQMQQAYMMHFQQQYLMANMQQQYTGGYDFTGNWIPPAAPTTYEGSIKSINKGGKHAFIACQSVFQERARDVYLCSTLFPEGLKQFSRVKFGLGVSDKGSPKATWCELA